MKVFRKRTSVLLLLGLAFFLVACGGAKKLSQKDLINKDWAMQLVASQEASDEMFEDYGITFTSMEFYINFDENSAKIVDFTAEPEYNKEMLSENEIALADEYLQEYMLEIQDDISDELFGFYELDEENQTLSFAGEDETFKIFKDDESKGFILHNPELTDDLYGLETVKLIPAK